MWSNLQIVSESGFVVALMYINASQEHVNDFRSYLYICQHYVLLEDAEARNHPDDPSLFWLTIRKGNIYRKHWENSPSLKRLMVLGVCEKLMQMDANMTVSTVLSKMDHLRLISGLLWALNICQSTSHLDSWHQLLWDFSEIDLF